MSPNVYLCIVSSIRIAYCFVRIAIHIVSGFFCIDPALTTSMSPVYVNVSHKITGTNKNKCFFSCTQFFFLLVFFSQVSKATCACFRERRRNQLLSSSRVWQMGSLLMTLTFLCQGLVTTSLMTSQLPTRDGRTTLAQVCRTFWHCCCLGLVHSPN